MPRANLTPLTEPQKEMAERWAEHARQLGRRAWRKLGSPAHLTREEAESIALGELVRHCRADWFDPDAKGLGLPNRYVYAEIQEIANRTRKRVVDLPRSYFSPSERKTMKAGDVEAVDDLIGRRIYDVHYRTPDGHLLAANQPARNGEVAETFEVGDFLEGLPAEVRYVLAKRMEGVDDELIRLELDCDREAYADYLSYAAAAYSGEALPELMGPTNPEEIRARPGPKGVQTHSYLGESLTLRELSDLSDLSVGIIRWRLENGWSVAKAVETPPVDSRARRPRYTYWYRGKERSALELAEIAGTNDKAMRNRLARLTPEMAVNMGSTRNWQKSA